MTEAQDLIVSHRAQRDLIAAYFQAREGALVSRDDLRALVGDNYRSRISECHTELGMHIENVPQFVVTDGKRRRTYGAYRFLANPLGGRDAATWISGQGEMRF